MLKPHRVGPGNPVLKPLLINNHRLQAKKTGSTSGDVTCRIFFSSEELPTSYFNDAMVKLRTWIAVTATALLEYGAYPVLVTLTG